MESCSDIFSASGNRGCSFWGLPVLSHAPETGHHSGEGNRESWGSTKRRIINWVITWHTAIASLATWILQLSAIRLQATFNINTIGGGSDVDNPKQQRSPPDHLSFE